MELLILTPERTVIEESVDEVILPGKLGEMGVLPGHTHLIAELDIGVVIYKEAGYDREKAVYISGGVVEIKDDVVKILTSSGEKGEEIDVGQAEKEKKRAEAELAREGAYENQKKFIELEIALKKALAKLQAARYR